MLEILPTPQQQSESNWKSRILARWLADQYNQAAHWNGLIVCSFVSELAKERAWGEKNIWKRCGGAFVCISIPCACFLFAMHANCLFELHPGLNFRGVICARRYLLTNYALQWFVYSLYALHLHNVLPLDCAPLSILSIFTRNDFDIHSQVSKRQQPTFRIVSS